MNLSAWLNSLCVTTPSSSLSNLCFESGYSLVDIQDIFYIVVSSSHQIGPKRSNVPHLVNASLYVRIIESERMVNSILNSATQIWGSLKCNQGSTELIERERSTPSWTQQHRYGAQLNWADWVRKKSEVNWSACCINKSEAAAARWSLPELHTADLTALQIFPGVGQQTKLLVQLIPQQRTLDWKQQLLGSLLRPKTIVGSESFTTKIARNGNQCLPNGRWKDAFYKHSNPDAIKGQLCQFCRELLFRKCRHSGGRQKDGSGKTDWTQTIFIFILQNGEKARLRRSYILKHWQSLD